MNEDIIKDEITIRVSSLIDLLSFPLAVQMQYIRHCEKQGYTENEINPNRAKLFENLKYAFCGYVTDDFTFDLDINGFDIAEAEWARDYLKLYYLSNRENILKKEMV